mmetsp:Transcript_25207/g.64024  ORF Transcript_25207/g.64024 Transcript_25207/m.64024 type:complete len:220 (+) Transcript_25207:365-1024(+)
MNLPSSVSSHRASLRSHSVTRRWAETWAMLSRAVLPCTSILLPKRSVISRTVSNQPSSYLFRVALSLISSASRLYASGGGGHSSVSPSVSSIASRIFLASSACSGSCLLVCSCAAFITSIASLSRFVIFSLSRASSESPLSSVRRKKKALSNCFQFARTRSSMSAGPAFSSRLIISSYSRGALVWLSVLSTQWKVTGLYLEGLSLFKTSALGNERYSPS